MTEALKSPNSSPSSGIRKAWSRSKKPSPASLKKKPTPQQILKYIAVISHGKSLGEIDGEDGLGNADFNTGLQGPSAYAYEIKELYQLREPIPLTEMKKKYGMTFPQRYVYVSDSMTQDIQFQNQTRLF
ncbi:hypothetical protein C0995_007286 [Termitomyces sp. Mi166|nr:hypothetical protein C0995_007286 [Termitomyces sp. Mi166\